MSGVLCFLSKAFQSLAVAIFLFTSSLTPIFASDDQTPPALAVTNPVNGSVVNNAKIVITGTATDAGVIDSGIASVTVNGAAAAGGTASSGSAANWSAAVTLTPGLNTIAVVATDGSPSANQATLNYTVIYRSPDLNGDGKVDNADLDIMKSRFYSNDPQADLNGDGIVNFADLAILKSFFPNATLTLQATLYDRGQNVPLAGTVMSMDGNPFANVPVSLDVESNGAHRQYLAYTNASGSYSYTFQPLSNEAGLYTVTASYYQSLPQTASGSFRILGLLVEPANVVLDMSMNSSRTFNVNLSNIGDIPLTNIQYSLTSSSPQGPVTGFVDVAGLPTALNPGQSVAIPVIINAGPGNLPAAPVVFTVNASSVEGSQETLVLTANLHQAVSLPVVTPNPLVLGVRTGESATKTITVANQGYAPMTSAALTLHDPATYGWITVVNGALGSVDPAQTKTAQVDVTPPSNTPLGTYVVQMDLSYDGLVIPVYLTVEVTTATVGKVAFKVHDDTGKIVPGAEVNLISKTFYVSATPQGTVEYNNVIKGVTDAQGYVLLTDVPAGGYRYLISAAGHDPVQADVTVEPGNTAQTLGIVMVTNLVNVNFSVTPTTIQDQYSVSLNITYATDLIKPTLYASPSSLNLSFFPEETNVEGTITLTNTSNNVTVRDVTLNAANLDAIDNEVKVNFVNGSQLSPLIPLGELGPKQTIQVTFRATIPNALAAKLNGRSLGNIIATGKYTFSIEGAANESTTTTPIPVFYSKPPELSLPGIAYVNDETDGNLNDLKYQGTSYRLTVKSNRNVQLNLNILNPNLKAVTQLQGGPDASSIINQNAALALWVASFNSPTTLTTKGSTTTFDITGLQDALEAQMRSARETLLGKPHYVGFFARWQDRTADDAYLIPITITTIKQNQIVVSDNFTSTSSSGFVGPSIPVVPSVPLNTHGEVKIQIDQKISLEREAFNARFDLTPTVPTLDNVSLRLNIRDANNNDASSLFFVLVTQKSGIESLSGSSVTGPAGVNWQIIPSSSAGGTTPAGQNYTISATIDYGYGGNSYSFTTQPETVTVQPMPKLAVDYYLPYVVMAGRPVKIKARITNQGSGTARNLAVSSAQPKIVENVNQIPVSFAIDGSSSTAGGSAYQGGAMNINFGDVQPGNIAEGYWQLTSTGDGYFVEFTSSLKHQNYLGVQLDPLITQVNTHFVPAIGGRISQSGCTTGSLSVEVWQGTELKGRDTVDSSGAYFISDLASGSYQWLLKDSTGATLSSRKITVLADQPTALIGGGGLTGYLLDATTGAALANVTVTVDGARSTVTDSNGYYSISGLGCGTHTVSVQTPSGYQSYGSRTVDSYNGLTFNIQLTKNETSYGLNTQAGYAADPVNTATGNYTYERSDLAMPGKGMPFAFARAYNSQAASAPDATDGSLGYGWTHTYNTKRTVTNGNVTIQWGDGRTETYSPDGLGGFKPQYGVFDTLTADGGGAYSLRKKDLRVYRFDTTGKLSSIGDKNGNTIALTYIGGNLTRITDTAGRNTDFTYDAGNHITRITDPLGRAVQYAYDGSGNLVSATDRNSKVTRYTYDASHQILTVTDPRGNVVVSNTYDATKRVVTYQTDAKGGATSYSYSELDRVTTITDALSHVTTHYHDDLLRLIKEVDARGFAAQYAYDDRGNRVQVMDKNGNVTKYEYDTRGNVTKKTDALTKVTAITYDGNNNPLTRADALGKITQFTYDANGNLTRTTDALGNAVNITYDASGLPLTVTDARSNVTTNTYDAQGNLVQVAAPLGNTTTYTYDGAGRRLTKTDALSHITAYSYDNNDNLRTATDALNGVMRYTYDGNNNRLAETDRRGYTMNYTYDRKDLLTVAKDPFGKAVTNTYDALDRKIAVVDKKGSLTKFAYDETGNLRYLTDALGNVTQHIYDTNGNRIAVRDPLGHTSNFTYDALNRRVTASDALDNTATTVYDDVGRVASTTNAKGQTTSFTYDAIGRLTKVTDANGGIVQHGYDQNGNRISMTDPNGRITNYAYDALNRLITKTEPLGNVTQYQYDTVGNLTRLTKPNGAVVLYAYDVLNRLVTVTYPDSSTVSFIYDANGNRIQMAEGLGTTTEQYDALNRMTRHTDPFGNIVRYNYDANGNRTVLIYPGGQTVTYSYDRLNRLRNVTDWLTRRTSYSYDAAGRLTQVTNPNGTKAAYGFDNADRLTSLMNTNGAAVISSYAYTMDAIGNHTQETRDEPLTPALTPGTVAYTYDAENRLASVNGVLNGFDPNGNMTAKDTNTFAYDFEDRLKQSTINNTLSQYQYDGVGNRLAKTAGATTTRYVLDLNSRLSKVLAETNASNTVSAYYVYGLGLIARIEPSGTARYYHYDSRGSTIALTDSTGAVTDKYAYDSFGKLANSQGSTPNPFKYVGRYGVMDESNGLQYIRARYYDPEAGRFISKDPKAGKDGDGQSLNRYVYTENNPIMFVDISGFNRNEVPGPATDMFASSDPDNNVLIAEAISVAALKQILTSLAQGDFAETANLHGFDSTGGAAFQTHQAIPIINIFVTSWRDAYDDTFKHPERNNYEALARFFLDVTARAGIGLVGKAATSLGGPKTGAGVSIALSTAYSVNREQAQNWALSNINTVSEKSETLGKTFATNYLGVFDKASKKLQSCGFSLGCYSQ